jgi:plasmid stabilization system protein ParE
MTKQVDITPEAEQDIYAITINILQQVSAEAAKNAALEFNRQLLTLANFTDQGRPIGNDGTREVVLSGLPYIAVYRIEKDNVTVIRILYGEGAKF